jgi:hypothetical protein
LTGNELLLVVAADNGNLFSFSTPKLEPLMNKAKHWFMDTTNQTMNLEPDAVSADALAGIVQSDDKAARRVSRRLSVGHRVSDKLTSADSTEPSSVMDGPDATRPFAPRRRC